MRTFAINVGATSIAPGRAVRHAVAYFALTGALAASAAMSVGSGFTAPPKSASGRLKVVVAGGSVSSGTLSVKARIPGLGPLSREYSISITTAGDYYTNASLPAGGLFLVSSSAGFGSGTTITISMEIPGVQAATDGATLLAGVSVWSAAAAQWDQLAYSADQLLDALSSPPGLLVDSGLSAVLGKEMCIGASGLGRMLTDHDPGDIIGQAVGGTVIQVGSSYYLPIKLGPRAVINPALLTGLTLWGSPVVGEVGYQTSTPGTVAKARADSFATASAIGAYQGVAGTLTARGKLPKVFLVAGLNSGTAPAAGQPICLSATVAGGGSNTFPPTPGHYITPLGILADATGYNNGTGSAHPIIPIFGATSVIVGS